MVHPIDPAHAEYLRTHTVGEDGFLRDLRAAAAEAGIPAISISADAGGFLHILLRLMGAQQVVEVGTLAGYSSIWMARALPADGRVRTIELEPMHADFAESWIARSDVAGRIEVHRGPGLEVLAGFEDGSADAALIDADKENYPGYLDACLRVVRPGGLIAVDNAFAFGHMFDDESSSSAGVRAIRAFNERMAADPRVRSIIVPFGDGCWIGVRE